MALADIPQGPPTENPGEYDYSHVLSPSHRASGYSLRVHDQNNNILSAHVYHGDDDLGGVFSLLDGDTLDGPSAGLRAPQHRGIGLGRAAYEALYAHAYHKGARRVVGGGHSAAASKVHQRLSQKHALDYVPVDGSKQYWNGRLGPYEYALKSELSLEKSAMPDTTDYSHLLTPEEREHGYELRVRERRSNVRGYRGVFPAEAELIHPSAGDPSGHGLPKGLVLSQGFFLDPAAAQRKRFSGPVYHLDDDFFHSGHTSVVPRLAQAIEAHRWNSRPLEARAKDLQAEYAAEADPSKRDHIGAQLVNADHEMTTGMPHPAMPPVRKAEQFFQKTEDEHTQDKLAADMLGHNERLRQAIAAARFLAGDKAHDPTKLRSAYWEADGDSEVTALRLYGFEPHEKHLRALRGILALTAMKKAEGLEVAPANIRAVKTEGQDVAEAVQRAYAARAVRKVELGGKHSSGTLLATDPESGKAYLLKPGSGAQSPAAGENEDRATQSEREVGVYHVVRNWGIGTFYPRAELLLIDGRQYAALEMLPTSYQNLNDIKARHPGAPRNLFHPFLKNGILFKWAIADWILGQPDRNAGNIMARLEPTPHGLDQLPQFAETEDVRLIDEGSAGAGPSFDPGHDRYSFVPYYLRAWFDGNFNALSVEDKLNVMPRLDQETEKQLRQWLDEIDAHKLQEQLASYRMTPDGPELRLATLRSRAAAEPLDLVLNRLWVGAA